MSYFSTALAKGTTCWNANKLQGGRIGQLYYMQEDKFTVLGARKTKQNKMDHN